MSREVRVGSLFSRLGPLSTMIASNHPPRPVFEPGQLVRHRRYGYRGVVVDRNEFCEADNVWYSKNQTQPDRDQPWYHVLVDGSSTCTYAASENLVADSSGLPIEHPLLPHFFSEFKNGIYIRNDDPWSG
jgi:heat shock protein HspQ